MSRQLELPIKPIALANRECQLLLNRRRTLSSSTKMSLSLNLSFIDLALIAVVVFVVSFLMRKWQSSRKWKPLLSHGNYPPVTPLELDQEKRNQLLKRRKNYKLIELNLINRLIGIVIFSLRQRLRCWEPMGCDCHWERSEWTGDSRFIG